MDTAQFDHVLINGDLNFDPSRQSAFVTKVREWLQRVNLHSVWEKHPVDYTHIHTDFVSTSTLDHFVCNEALLEHVTQAGAMHLGDNPSRHSPIMLRLDLGQIQARQSVVPPPRPRRPAWYKAGQEELHDYTEKLYERVEEMEVPASLLCRDPHCQSELHKQERDKCMLDVLSALCDTASECIPMTGGGTVQGTPSQKFNILILTEPHKNTTVLGVPGPCSCTQLLLS